MAFKRLVGTCIFLFSLGLAPVEVVVGQTSPTVDLGYAIYQGVLIQDAVTHATHTQFLGMRYAAPPTGTRRFATPAVPAFTPGVQLADTEPSRCMAAGKGLQPNNPFRKASSNVSSAPRSVKRVTPAQSEDCLFLNVYVPGNFKENKNLPVVFWIHGGGYANKSGSDHNGNDLVRESGEGVVAIMIQYRLGLFGFLSGQKVKDGGALNAGLLDQQFALQWVQKHIGKFGGDPSKVTIWGASAGGGSVMQHVIANGGNTRPPLFRAAMTSSLSLTSQYRFNDRIPELIYEEAVSQSNCSSAVDSLKCLREADVSVLEAANTGISKNGFFGTFVFVPVVDGEFIIDRPTQLLKRKKINGEMLYSVTNTFEGTIFVDKSTANTVTTPEYLSQMFPNFGPKEIQAGTAQYAGLGSNIFQADAIMGESIFLCPTYFLLRAFSGKSFKAEFAIPPGHHGQDASYYFNKGYGATPAYGNPAFDNAFAQSFLDFVISLNTNVKWDPTNITPTWKLWEGFNEMLFNKTDSGEPVIELIKTDSKLLERCDFWEEVSGKTAQ